MALKKNYVPGEGKVPCKIMFVGEAPGSDEDKMKRPFVGVSGRFLMHYIKNILNLSRKDIYATNSYKFRPPDNRAPTDSEIIEGREELYQEIKKVNPVVIVALGKTALKSVFSLMVPKTIFFYRNQELFHKPGMRIIATYHPSSVMQTPSLIRPFKEDLLKAKTLMKGRRNEFKTKL